MPRDVVFSTTTDDLLNVDWDAVLSFIEQSTPDAGGGGGVDLVSLRASGLPDLPFTSATVRGQRALAVHWTRGAGVVRLGPTARAEDGTDVPVPGHWVDLDWAQTNRLIRFLRNARDQAFGKPE